MSQEINKSRRAETEVRPNQHISSIAHLFFDNSETESSASKVLTRHIMVVGTGRDTCAPYTAAGLGHHLLDQSTLQPDRGTSTEAMSMQQVFFGEPSPVCFSALSHLKESTYRTPSDDEVVPWESNSISRGPVLRLFPGTVPSEDFSGGIVEGKFFIRHLDLPREAELQGLETQFMAGQSSSVINDGADVLIWCVRRTAASSLALTSRLGRLLRIIRPQKVHLLVFGGPGNGKSNSHESFSNNTETIVLTKAQQLLKFVAGDAAVNSCFMAVSVEERTVQLRSLARQIALS